MMSRPALLAAASVAALVAAPAVAAAEPFSGSVLDGTTLGPIAGATVTAPDGQTATTNSVGGFTFADLPPGPLEFVVAAPGYDPTAETVELVDGGLSDYIFILFEPGFAAEVIEIEEEAPVPPPPGRQDLGRKEITRIPGSRGDALTAVKSLPGVGQAQAAGAGASQIVIRGAAPEDSKVTIDGIEVPVLYHFFGLQSVLPSEFIDNIEFLPGGFGAEEGRATGGVINVVTRAEAITEPEGFAELSFINVAGFFQTPLSLEHGLQLSGALRRSTIDLVLPAVIPDDANLAFTTAPQYYDGQLRLDWRRRENERVSVLALTSFDLLSLLSENLDPNEPDFTGKFDNETSFTRIIGTWLRGAKGRTNRLVAAVGTSGFRLEIGDDRFLRFRQYTAEVRDDLVWKVDDRITVRAGGEARWDRRDLNTRFPQAPGEGQPPPGNFSSLPLVDYMAVVNNDVLGAYAAADFKPIPSLRISPSVRFDRFAFLGESTIGPRLQVAQELGDRWTVRGALGVYSRGLEQAESVDASLRPETATQYVVGAKYVPVDGVTIESSLFYTDKRDLVVVDQLKYQTDPLRAYVNRGYGRTFGAEALVRVRRDDFFGWLAYTVNRSDRIDGPESPRRLFDFDQTHNVIAVGSYTLGRWEIGAKWQYATGTPFTPVTGSLYLSDLNAFIPVYGAVNSDRIEAAHQLDLRIDRKWRFDTWRLSAYLDVTNVYANARVIGYTYNYDFTERQPIEDLPIVPAIGVRGEI